MKVSKRVESDRLDKKKEIEKPLIKFENDSDWKKWWWEEINSKCLDCQRECKQSSKVEIGYCPQFLPLKKVIKEEKIARSEKISDFLDDFVSG